MDYCKFKYMDEAAIKEVGELMIDGHEKALMMFGLECANDGVEVAKSCILKGIVKGAITGVVIAGGVQIGTRIVRKVRAKKLAKKQTEEKTKV